MRDSMAEGGGAPAPCAPPWIHHCVSYRHGYDFLHAYRSALLHAVDLKCIPVLRMINC